jgi:hypothetical protein
VAAPSRTSNDALEDVELEIKDSQSKDASRVVS